MRRERAGPPSAPAKQLPNVVTHQVRALFTSNSNMNNILMSHPDASDTRDFYFSSSRTGWARAHLDPPRAGKYWRSLIGSLALTAAQWRAGG